jgi:hypothetical protein
MDSFPLTVEKIHAQFHVSDAPAGTKFNAKWYMHDIETDKREEIISTDYQADGTGLFEFTLKPNGTLKEGRYFVDISVNGTLSHSLFFFMK